MTTLHFHGFPAPSRPVFLLFVFVRDGFGQHAGEDGGGIGVRMDGDGAPRAWQRNNQPADQKCRALRSLFLKIFPFN